MRRLSIAVAIVAAVQAFGAAAASASTVSASPGGGITAQGTLTFSFGNQQINVICPVTLRGSLTTSATGTLPITNIGGITGGSVGACTSNQSGTATVALLADASTNRWSITSKNVASGVASMTFVGMKFLVGIALIGSCLYTGDNSIGYSNSSGALTPGPYTVRATTTLSGSCSTSVGVGGTLVVSPTQTITLA
jgi:hypothetical protein